MRSSSLTHERSLAVSALALWVAGAACAQTLDLGPTAAAPRPGEGLAALALADTLGNEASRWDENDPRHAFRVLASDLLRKGENAGAAGAEALLAGLTLAAKRDRLDALLDALGPAPARYVADTLNHTERSIAPREVDLILRDALAPLNADADARCGWWGPPGAEPVTAEALDGRIALLRELLENTALSDAAGSTLREFIDLAGAARDEPAYRRSAAAWADLIVGAGAILHDPPAWLDMPARDLLRADLSWGTSLIFDKPDDARRILERAARLLRVVAATDSLPDDLQSRDLREAVSRLAGAPEGDPKRTPDAVRRIADAYALALDMIAAEARTPRPEQLVRQTRPMLGPLADAHRRAADAMVRLLPTILGDPDPMTDPAVLAATASLRQATADLGIAADLSGVLASWTEDPTRPAPALSREPVTTRLMGPLAERVRQLGVALGRDDQAPEALEQLRTLREDAALAPEMPGERELRADASSPAWRRVTGDQASRLLFLADQARQLWLRSVATDQFADQRPEDRARLQTLASVLPILADAARVEAMRTDWSREIPPAANQRPGWELTREGLDALAGDLTQRAARLAALAARADDHATAMAAAEDLRRDFAAALLCARIERESGSLPDCSVAAELGSGSPDAHAWRAADRHALAAVCRAAFEAAGADGSRRDALVRYANSLAAEMP